MINAKRLSLKTLNTLKEVSVEPVYKMIPLQTFERIPVGCKQSFAYNGDFSEFSARMAIKKLNGETSNDKYVLLNSGDGMSMNVYHLTMDFLEKALNDRKEECRLIRLAKNGYKI